LPLGDSVSERGFVDAVAELRKWIMSGDYRQPTAFRYALGSLYELESMHRIRLTDSRYFAERAADADGQVVGGMIYARGLAVHKDSDVADLIGRRPFTVGRSALGGGDTLRGPGVALVWIAFTALPSPDNPEKHGRDAMYQQHVEGRDVLDTISDAERFFVRVATVT
jgi:hypothetical protein